MTTWKDIQGFDGRYQISDDGIVRNRSGRILAQFVHNHGYRSVNLTLRDGKGGKKTCLVHRLVAVAFIPNPDAKPTVNHLDGCKHRNVVDNLEWATHSENHKHAYDSLGRKASITTLRDSSRQCAKLLDGAIVATYASARSAAKANGLRERSVARACRGERITCGGFEWKYL